MNRAQKRAMQKMGAVTAEGAPVRTPRTPPTPRPRDERTGFRQFLREVRSELRKVVWPSREEVRNYSIIVLITVVLFTAFVAVLDYLFGSASLWLYDR
jgi:preprotein translocase subunit SecE